MDTLLTGAVFGGSLVVSGMFQPWAITSQLALENWDMIQTFLTATATSVLLVVALQKTGLARLKPRDFSSLGWFARYDGNLIGGALLGQGMAISGSCPGTVLSQVALGVRSGYYALGGAVLGGVAWTGFLRPWLSGRRLTKPDAGHDGGNATPLTVYDALGLNRTLALVGFEALLVAAALTAATMTTPGPGAKIHPVVGGLVVGGAQLLSLLLRKSLIGVSTSYEEVGEWFWSVARGGVGGRERGDIPPKYTSILFSLGVAGGSWLVGRLFPRLVEPVGGTSVSPLSAAAGGFLIVVGSRTAGGCTSGHGISGMALLSTSSLVTMGAAFAWGAVVSQLARP